MIERMLPFQFVKKSPYYGSYKGMNYRIIAKDGALEACVFPGPYIFDKTGEEKKIYETFAFSEEGYDEVWKFINREYEAREWDGRL